MENSLKRFSGEFALLIGMVLNSFGVTIMLKSGFGISCISSLPFVFSEAWPIFTLGVWNYLFQGFLIVLLCILTRGIKLGYVLSFVVGVAYGYFMDFFNFLVKMLPDNIFLNIIYYSIGFFALCIGMAMLLKCKLPVMPIDTFCRDMPGTINIQYKYFKTGFDLVCLAATVILSFIFLGHLEGIGIGTVISALLAGKIVSVIVEKLDQRYYFEPTLIKMKNLV